MITNRLIQDYFRTIRESLRNAHNILEYNAADIDCMADDKQCGKLHEALTELKHDIDSLIDELPPW